MAPLTLIATYDVREDDRRARLAAVLQTYGDRVQKSVFVILIDNDELPALQAHALRIVDTRTDSFLIFRQCQPCWDAQIAIGQARTPTPTLYWAVF